MESDKLVYSVDLRERVVDFVRQGGGKAEAARRFQVSRWCVYDWLGRETLVPEKAGPKDSWKLDRKALQNAVESRPEATLDELAEEMGTQRTAVWHALNRMKISRKKNVAVR